MITALIVAAGQGVRMGGGLRKQYMSVGGRPILETTLKAFGACPQVTHTVLVVPETELAFCRDTIVRDAHLKRETVLVPGGDRRQDSVYNGLRSIEEKEGAIVLIHDGVRPFVTASTIAACISGARRWGACIPALEVNDTLKQIRSDGVVEATLPRERLFLVQTPQAFKLALIKAAHEKALGSAWEATDDAGLVERMGGEVHVIPGDVDNIKITTPDDLKRAEALWRSLGGTVAG